MKISASLVKELREKSGAGMMDCKKALSACNGNITEAVVFLRKEGLATASKKQSRVAAEGLIACHVDGQNAAIIELNSETDFVAKNDQFQQLAQILVSSVIEHDGDLHSFKSFQIRGSNKKVEDLIIANIATIDENINLRRFDKLQIKQGLIVSYVHNIVAKNLGTIGVLVALESSAAKDDLMELGKQIAMHIAAINPLALNIDELDHEIVKKERDILSEQAKNSGKPDNIIDKMIDGRIKKFYSEVVLLEQPFIMDNQRSISEVIADQANILDCQITLTGYIRYALGDGIEKEEVSFAKDVAKAINN